MSTTIKSIIAIIVLGAVGFGVWKSGILASTPQPVAEQQATTTPAVQEPQYGMSASNDASDEALAQDSAALDAQIQAMQSDSANTDASLSDKQLPQSY